MYVCNRFLNKDKLISLPKEFGNLESLERL